MVSLCVKPSNSCPGVDSRSGVCRGQSETLGFVLLFGIVLVGALAIVGLGVSAIGGFQQDLSADRAEKTLTQFNSQAGLVALGGADAQRMSLPSGDEGQYQVNEDEGWMRVTAIKKSGGEETVMNTTLGSVSYENGETQIAYQGGGVWRASDAGGTMVSPPEFHYRDGTLTLPAVNITGSGQVDGELTVTHEETTEKFPMSQNPLQERKINVTVKSQHYLGWAQYFEERTNSDVTVREDENEVTATLVPPPTPVTIDGAIIGSGDLELKSTATGAYGPVSLGEEVISGESEITGKIEENVTANKNLETATSKIVAAESRAKNASAPPDFSTVTAGTYAVSDDSIFDDQTTFDTSGGDIELYVDGDMKADGTCGAGKDKDEDKDKDKGKDKDKDKGKDKDKDKGKDKDKDCPDVDVTGEGEVRIYVDGEFNMNGQAEWGTKDQVDSLFVYSKEAKRVTALHGVLYTDAVKVRGQGSTAMYGAVISTADKITTAGNFEVEYAEELDGIVLEEVEVEFALITYLHVTENVVKVD